MSEDGPRLSRAVTYFDRADDYGSFGQAFITMISGIFLAIGAGLIAIQESMVNIFVTIFDAFGIGAESWIFAFTRDPAGFISSSFQSASASMMSGPWAELGPFLPWLAAAVAIGVVGIITWYLDRRDSDVPGLGVDLPVIGNDEDGDPDDE